MGKLRLKEDWPKDTQVLSMRVKPALPDRKACEHPGRPISSSQLKKVTCFVKEPGWRGGLEEVAGVVGIPKGHQST